jgi:hypothetical protein
LTKGHRGPYKTNPKHLLKKSDNLTQQTIVCIHELSEKRPNWEHMEVWVNGHTYNSKTGRSDWWDEQVGGRRAIFVRIEDSKKIRDMIYQEAHDTNLRKFSGVAYPSSALTLEVEQILQITPIFHINPFSDDNFESQSCIYVIYEQERPIYVGQTKSSVLNRFWGHWESQKKPEDGAGFMDYVRYRNKKGRTEFSPRVLSYEECRTFAIQGQLSPDLANNQEARRLLNEKYSDDHEWGLKQAETALITYFRPHFNQDLNYYPNPLQNTEYCEQKKCSICWPTS